MSSNRTISNGAESAEGSWSRDDTMRVLGGYLISLVILLCSALPAAAIWRSSHLHRSSYYYVMVLCLLDCGVGVAAFVMTSVNFAVNWLAGGVSAIGCCALVNMVNMSMNAMQLMMLALGRDRYLSVKYPLRYPLLVSPDAVWWHLKLAIAYGVLQGIAYAIGYNYDLPDSFCSGLKIMMSPQHRILALITVGSNVILDFGTIYYNAKVIHCAWKVRQGMKSDNTAWSLCSRAALTLGRRMVCMREEGNV